MANGVRIAPCDTPPPFLSVSPVESMRSGGATPPPPQKGYLGDTGAIPYENKANGCDNPPLRYYLEKVLRDRGGISHWAAKVTGRVSQGHPAGQDRQDTKEYLNHTMSGVEKTDPVQFKSLKRDFRKKGLFEC